MKWWTLAVLGLTACNGDKDENTGETATDTSPPVEDCPSAGVDTTACEGAIVGTFAGDESGVITGTMRDDGVLFVSFELEGTGIVNACAVLQEDGTISGSQADVTIDGTYDVATCMATGVWAASSVAESGTWEVSKQ